MYSAYNYPHHPCGPNSDNEPSTNSTAPIHRDPPTDPNISQPPLNRIQKGHVVPRRPCLSRRQRQRQQQRKWQTHYEALREYVVEELRLDMQKMQVNEVVEDPVAHSTKGKPRRKKNRRRPRQKWSNERLTRELLLEAFQQERRMLVVNEVEEGTDAPGEACKPYCHIGVNKKQERSRRRQEMIKVMRRYFGEELAVEERKVRINMVEEGREHPSVAWWKN